jgi:hypothetical protein
VCKIYLKSLSLTFEKPESESESNSSFNDGESDSMSDSEGGSNSSNDKVDASKLVPCISSKEIFPMCTQRRVTVKNGDPVVVTFTLLAIQEGKQMLGVRAVALNTSIIHESGIFFLIDQLKWKEDMKTYTAVSCSVQKHMKTFGFDYLLQNCLVLVPHK